MTYIRVPLKPKILVFCTILLCSLQTGAQTAISPQKSGSTAYPAGAYRSVTANGAWCWFSDPRAVYYEGAHKRTYAGWVDNFGNICVGWYDHETGKTDRHIVRDTLEIDDHNNPSLLFDQKGRLLVFFNMHMAGEQPLFMVRARKPENIHHWEPVRDLFLNDSSLRHMGSLNHTYTNPVQLSEEDGRIFLFWRGVDGKPCWSYSDDRGSTWSTGEILFMPKRTYGFRRPYTKVCSEGKGTIHFTFTDGHPRKEKHNSIYYMRYRDGAFYRADGSLIKTADELPVRPEEADLVYDAAKSGKKAWNWDIAATETGQPVVAYAKFPNDSNHIYGYARWTGETWKNYELVNSGKWFPETQEGFTEPEPNYSGGLNIDHETPNTLYLSVMRNGVFEIERWTTPDGGASWQVEEVTSGSGKDNVRPFAVRGAQAGNPVQVLWMRNRKYLYFAIDGKFREMDAGFEDRFDTAIKINVLKKP